MPPKKKGGKTATATATSTTPASKKRGRPAASTKKNNNNSKDVIEITDDDDDNQPLTMSRNKSNSSSSSSLKRSTLSTTSSKVVKKETETLESFISSHADENSGNVEIAQFEGFFGALGVDLSTIDPYIFFWKMNVQGCWCATQDELKEGFGKHGVIFPGGKKKCNAVTLVSKWKKELQTEMGAFKEFHTFVFNFIRASPSAKVIHLELDDDTTGEETLRMVLQLLPTRPKFSIDTLIDYLKEQKKPLNQDHWKQLVRFLTTMNGKCDGYDDAFFPTILDTLAERCAKTE